MNRDSILFLALLLFFAVANAYLFAAGTLSPDWTGFGIIVAAGLTLALYSFLYRDNPFFKLAEHIFVGVAAGYVFGQTWYPTIYGEVIDKLSGLGEAGAWEGKAWLVLFPTALGILMLTRFSTRIGWTSRIAFGFFFGLGAGFTIPAYISTFILKQVEPTLQPITLSWAGLDLFIILVGVVSVLVYFFFSVEHRGAVGMVSKLGIWVLMISFGASFGYTIMARLSLLIGRVRFLLDDWLNLM